MFLVADIYRGRTRIQTVRLFENLVDANAYYANQTHTRHLWEINPDDNKPMIPLSGKTLLERLEKSKNILGEPKI